MKNKKKKHKLITTIRAALFRRLVGTVFSDTFVLTERSFSAKLRRDHPHCIGIAYHLRGSNTLAKLIFLVLQIAAKTLRQMRCFSQLSTTSVHAYLFWHHSIFKYFCLYILRGIFQTFPRQNFQTHAYYYYICIIHMFSDLLIMVRLIMVF